VRIHFYPILNFIVAALVLVACAAPAVQEPAATPTGAGQAAAASTSSTAPTNVPATHVSQATAPAASVTDTPSSPASEIPLQDALGNLQPQDVFENLYQITRIPRPSGYMDQIREFLVTFGQGLGLEPIVDEAGNVIIRKPAAPGFENRSGVVLQAHMDMVAQKADDKSFDFTTDPIQAFVSGDYIVTDGTTLGADDGIGMAMIMAVLQSTSLQIGPVEALFTVDEESTMSGANGLKADTLKGRILINLDSETEGSFTIGSAGGERAINTLTPGAGTGGHAVLCRKRQGLQGGRSGVDINKGRGHATEAACAPAEGQKNRTACVWPASPAAPPLMPSRATPRPWSSSRPNRWTHSAPTSRITKLRFNPSLLRSSRI
jgi:hypothetical protein